MLARNRSLGRKLRARHVVLTPPMFPTLIIERAGDDDDDPSRDCPGRHDFRRRRFSQPPPAIYTAVQATAGAPIFSTNCAMCHGADMKGAAAPALLGQAFASVSSKTSVGGVFSLVAEQMPANNPGGLTHEQYVQVMAYIRSKNGYPAGSTPLDYNASLTSTLPFVSQVP